MTENTRHKPANQGAERKLSRAEIIRGEMAEAVRLLGGGGRTASEQNHFAARHAGLPVTVIERLRWKKVKRIPADVADAVRDALDRATERAEARARHEERILRERLNALAALADNGGDPDFYGAQVAGVVQQARRLGLLDRPVAEAEEDEG